MTGIRGKAWVIGFAVVAALGAAGPAQATLIGDVINVSTEWGDLGATRSESETGIPVTLDPEFNCLAFTGICANPSLQGGPAIDVQDSSIRILLGEDSFPVNFFRFTSLDWVGRSGFISGVKVDFSGLADLGTVVPRATFGAHDVFLDLSGVRTSGGELLLTLSVTHDGPPTPEPGTLLLLGAGLAGLWYRRRQS